MPISHETDKPTLNEMQHAPEGLGHRALLACSFPMLKEPAGQTQNRSIIHHLHVLLCPLIEGLRGGSASFVATHSKPVRILTARWCFSVFRAAPVLLTLEFAALDLWAVC